MPSNQKNDPAALQAYVELLTTHQANLRAFIVSLMPGSPHVDDVLQETNAALWRKRARFEHGTNFVAWALKIARYEVLGQRHRTKRDDRLIVFTEKLIDVLTEMPPLAQSDEEVLSALDGCLAKLSEQERELVEARYTPGRSLKQHAAHIDRSAGSLRIALHRVRSALKDCVDTTLAAKPV